MVRKEIKIKTRPSGSETPAQEVFRRKEVKYVLTPTQAKDLLEEIAPHIEPDKYPQGTNCSIYFDNANQYLAMYSLEKPLYKEKIRVRSYNVPKSPDSTVFIEIKKKFNGVGNKRRVAARLKDFYDYLETGSLITENPQIRRELDYCFKHYGLKPYLFLAYDRHSYCGKAKQDKSFRLTFDQNIRYRLDDLRLENGDYGEKYFKNGEIIMEAKALDSYPLWFARALSKLKIYPTSFSKYGKVCLKIDDNYSEEFESRTRTLQAVAQSRRAHWRDPRDGGRARPLPVKTRFAIQNTQTINQTIKQPINLTRKENIYV